ncbi:MAG: replication restart helicase PriA, partial [Alphaproteobacteria bacterium]
MFDDLVSVLLPLPLAGAYDYRAPSGMSLTRGNFVAVPLGNREVRGVVWGPGSGEVATEKLKDVIGLLDLPSLDDGLMRTIEWVADYTLSAPGAVLRMAMSVPAALDPPKRITAYALANAAGHEAEGESNIRMTAARRRVLDALSHGPPRPLTELAREAAVSTGVVRGLSEAGLLASVSLSAETDSPTPDWRRPGPELSPAQRTAADALCDAVRKAAPHGAKAEDGFAVTLLDGVTGSGKTEVYFEALAAALSAGRQALVLLPEIALTAQWLDRFKVRFGIRPVEWHSDLGAAQWLDRFKVRFGIRPVEWHSDLGAAQRRRIWRGVIGGKIRLVVGARSSLFLPFPELGLIVIDEEQDSAFKQEDGVIYNARDMAVVRARMGGFPIVLASATPSLETVVNAGRGRYGKLHLPERHAGASLPEISLIDIRDEDLARQSWVTPTLAAALGDALARDEQAMLFLNRRGYAPLTLCRGCGHRLDCPQCTAWLVEHRLEGRLACHHCGFTMAQPEHCPKCRAEASFAACGPGVERLAEEIDGLFPSARTAIMASDTVQSPSAAAELVRRMQDRDIDILIGTQIMAKGHHFPLLTLVGVIDADLGLAGGDLRAAERTYQLLHQVAGRAGREERHGHVYLQTCMPEHPVMQALVSGERDAFIAAEAAAREAHHMPPFGRLAALIVSGPDEIAVDAAAGALGRTRPMGEGVTVLGPAPAPFAI